LCDADNGDQAMNSMLECAAPLSQMEDAGYCSDSSDAAVSSPARGDPTW
jgi:hypothetical protein